MYSLLITIISIALFGVLLSVGINYVDVDSIIGKRVGIQLESKVISLGMGATSYKNLFNKGPTTITQLSPAFVNLDTMPDGYDFFQLGYENYNGSQSVFYSCIEIDTASENYSYAYKYINSNYSPEQVLAVTDCNDQVDSVSDISNSNTLFVKFYYL